jgi:hypothetical protein
MVYSRKKSLKRRKRQIAGATGATDASQARHFPVATPEEAYELLRKMNFKYLQGYDVNPPNTKLTRNKDKQKRIITKVRKDLKNIHLRPSLKEQYNLKSRRMKAYEIRAGKRRFATPPSTFTKMISYLTKKQKNK